MYKIMLVDDEDELREGISASVDWERCGFTLCAQATGGYDALDKADQCQPDIVMTDVHMPFMNGLELIERLQERYPTMRYIILSGYDDFNYVKLALQRQVMDYILKPISSDGITTVLGNIRKKLDHQRDQRLNLERLRALADANEIQMRRAAFLELLFDGSGDSRTLCAGTAANSLELQFPLSIAVLSIELSPDNQTVLRRKFQDQPPLLIAAVQDVLQDVLEGYGQQACFPFRSQFVLSLACPQDTAVALLNEAIESIHQYLQLAASAGLSDPVKSPAAIAEAYQMALVALDKRLITGQGRIHVNESARPTVHAGLLTNTLLSEITMLTRGGESGDITDFFHGLAQQISAQDLNLSQRQLLLSSVISAILSSAERSGVDIASAFAELHIGPILQPADMTASLGQLGILTCFVSDAIRNKVSKSSSLLMEKILNYIDSSFHEEDLSIDRICSTFHVSQTQLSLLFKREKGTSFLQYLLNLRIDTACRLLAGTQKKVYEIASETGFSDASYFGYCFRQRCGITPKEYRMKEGLGI